MDIGGMVASITRPSNILEIMKRLGSDMAMIIRYSPLYLTTDVMHTFTPMSILRRSGGSLYIACKTEVFSSAVQDRDS